MQHQQPIQNFPPKVGYGEPDVRERWMSDNLLHAEDRNTILLHLQHFR